MVKMMIQSSRKRHNITPSIHTARGVFLAAVMSVFFILPAEAQVRSPQILITWEAHTYAPSRFGGKLLPATGSSLDASAEVVDQGKISSLKNTTVYWYLDDELVQSGQDLQKIRFRASDIAAGTMDLRVQIPDYPGGIILKTIQIPVVRPDVAIRRIPGDASRRSIFSLEALPYFFNVNSIASLGFMWSVNGTSPDVTSRPDMITVKVNDDAPAGTAISVRLGVQNTKDPLQGASRQIAVTL